ncbi:hypothetical protein DFH08DRAFT_1021130, partial [Mycena albidolilacea]
LGWSFGGASALVLLADPGIVPPQLYQTIEPYLHSLVLYDPPFEALGHIPPQLPEFYNAFSDPEYTTFDAKFANFQHWISSYFPHPDIASANAAGMFFAKAPTESANSTFGRWTNEEKMEYSDAAAALRADLPALSPAMQATLRAQFHSALFAPEIVSSYFPRTTILYISGAATCYPGMWGYMASYAMYTTAQARGDSLRATTFRLLEGENHFVRGYFLGAGIDLCNWLIGMFLPRFITMHQRFCCGRLSLGAPGSK